MARKNYIFRGESVLGVYPEDFERGHVPGRRGTRRVLCSKSDLQLIPEAERQSHLNELYIKKELELRKGELKNTLQVEEDKRRRRTAKFSEASKIWLDEVSNTQSPKTYKTYKNTITIYKDTVGDHRLNEFDRAKNIAFFTALAESGEAAPKLAKLSSTTFDAQLLVSSTVANDSPYLYFEIQNLNEYGLDPLNALCHSVERIQKIVDQGNEAEFVKLMKRGREYLSNR